MISIAYAMGTGGGAGQGAGPGGMIIPLVLMFAIMYFLVIRPQNKQKKQHQEMINNLKKGDKILTSGNIYGLITSIDETTITVEIADKVRVKMTRNSVNALVNPQPQKTPAEKKE